MRLIEGNEGKYTRDQNKDIPVKLEKLFPSSMKSNILRKISMDEKVSFGDAFLLHKVKNREGRTHSIMNLGNGSILERSRRNSKNSPTERQRDMSGLKSSSDNDTKSLQRERRQSGSNCTEVIHTECLSTPVKECQLKTMEKCSAVPRIQ